MAQYEADKDALKALTGPDSGLTAATQAAIIALINDSSASFVATQENGTATSDSSAEGLYASKGTNLNGATFDNVTTAVFDEGAKGSVNLTSDDNITAELVNPKGLNVKTGDGDNEIAVDGGQASVTTGSGEDLFALNGKVKGEFKSGLGDDNFQLDEAAQTEAEISVDAGDGFDMLTLIGNFVKHQFSFKNGQFHMSSADITLEKVEVVATDLNQDGRITDSDHITVLAKNANDSLVAKLYKIALGREAIDDGHDSFDEGNTLAGIKFWTISEKDDPNGFKGQDEYDGTLEQTARAFLACDEPKKILDGLNKEQFVDKLFNNLTKGNEELLDSDDDLKGDLDNLHDELLAKLNADFLDRTEVVIALASSDEAVKILGNDGEQYVIDGYEINV